jgi:hydrogenase maturation protease
MKILVAGIGDIFHGDDGFGCEVIRELHHVEFPDEVTVTDFGIRSYDLAYALADGYDLKILVDAITQKATPGTVYLMEPDLDRLNALQSTEISTQATAPIAALQLARSIGTLHGRFFVIGCEPEALGDDNGEPALSEPVREAVPQAVKMICRLVADALAVEAL